MLAHRLEVRDGGARGAVVDDIGADSSESAARRVTACSDDRSFAGPISRRVSITRAYARARWEVMFTPFEGPASTVRTPAEVAKRVRRRRDLRDRLNAVGGPSAG
jgi:hypothetical protein